MDGRWDIGIQPCSATLSTSDDKAFARLLKSKNESLSLGHNLYLHLLWLFSVTRQQKTTLHLRTEEMELLSSDQHVITELGLDTIKGI